MNKISDQISNINYRPGPHGFEPPRSLLDQISGEYNTTKGVLGRMSWDKYDLIFLQSIILLLILFRLHFMVKAFFTLSDD